MKARIHDWKLKARQIARRYGGYAFLPAVGVAFLPRDFSIDLSGMVDFASTIFNSLAPIIVILGGITLGLGLVSLVLGMIMKSVRAGGR